MVQSTQYNRRRGDSNPSMGRSSSNSFPTSTHTPSCDSKHNPFYLFQHHHRAMKLGFRHIFSSGKATSRFLRDLLPMMNDKVGGAPVAPEFTFLFGAILFLLFIVLYWKKSWPFGDSSHESLVESGNKRQAKPKPEVSLSINRILVDLPRGDSPAISPEDDAEPFKSDPDELNAFLTLCSSTELYVITKVSSDKEQIDIRKYLQKVGAVEKGLKEHRILFCSSDEGRASMVRQLQPAVHIEGETSVFRSLRGKVHRLMYVHPMRNANDQEQEPNKAANSSASEKIDGRSPGENSIDSLQVLVVRQEALEVRLGYTLSASGATGTSL